MFSNYIRDQGGGYSNLDKFSISIPSFDGSHDVESTFLCIEEIDNLFGMKYILMEDHVDLWFINLKEGLQMVGLISKYAYVPKQATYKNVKTDEKTLASP